MTEKNAKKRREAIKAEILHMLGDAEVGLIDGAVAVTAKTVNVEEAKKPRPAYSYRKVTFAKGAAV